MDKEFDVVIVGGGMAGMTAALTVARLGRSTVVLTGDVLGGQLVSIEKIEGLPGFPDGVPGYDLSPMMQDQVIAGGTEFMMTSLQRMELQDGKWRVTTGEGEVSAGAVILATGSILKSLDVPGEQRLRGKGVSHCASCDAPLLRDRIVAVVGGGDSAMQEALTLAESAAKVIMLQRDAELTGQAAYRERVLAHPKIDIRFDTTVSEVLGDSAVTGVRTHGVTNGGTTDIEVVAVFAYVGLQPALSFLSGMTNTDVTKGIPTDGGMRTEMKGVCAAGNVRFGSSCRAASAAGDGASAAISVDRYLTDGSW